MMSAFLFRFLPILFLFFGLFAGCSNGKMDDKYVSFSKTAEVMHTFMEIDVYGESSEKEKIEKVIDKAFAFALELEKKLSIFDPKSEITRLNISRKIKADPDLYEVIKMSIEAWRLTGGDFDITVAPILKKRGFYSDMPAELLDLIPESNEGMGVENILLTSDGVISLEDPGTWLDISGMAEGFIVDKVSEYLKASGYGHFLVNAGGEIYCTDKGPGGAAWAVGIRAPGGESIVKVLAVRNKAVSTSGDYENIIVDKNTGDIYSHIVDPGADDSMRQRSFGVTVIADNCAMADALSTGLMVRGAEKTVDLAETMDGVEVITVSRENGRVVIRASSGAGYYFSRG